MNTMRARLARLEGTQPAPDPALTLRAVEAVERLLADPDPWRREAGAALVEAIKRAAGGDNAGA
ncbi:MAG: hypothetical protein M0Z28_32215 [Rhodospirillales bacterium]|nr:hypothetical protein [Rhodospirillales bacterium]